MTRAHDTNPLNAKSQSTPSAEGRLTSITNSAGVVLDGIVFCPPNARLAVVHVHGSLGNFYQQPFIRIFARELALQEIALLSFNLTSHDGISEGYLDDREMVYIGGSISRFETCLDDIDALIRFGRSICPHVVLQGHSLGCDRVLYYEQQRTTGVPLVLLSPCDSYQLQGDWLAGETVEQQVSRLSREEALDDDVSLLPRCEYGLRGPDGWTYKIPVNRSTLLSILNGPPFRILRTGRSVGPVSTGPAFVYISECDTIRGATLDAMRSHVRQLLPAAKMYVDPNGDHSLDGSEAAVGGAIAQWARSMALSGEQS